MIGIFGGTFNPVHNGHVNLAVRLAEACSLEEVWFVPARCSPFKKEDDSLPASKRIHMLEMALSDLSYCKVVDIEIHRKGPSYTIDTLRQIKQQHSGRFRLILGSDTVRHFHKWKNPQEILQLAPPLIGCRSLNDFSEFEQKAPSVFERIKQGLVPLPIMEISATEIRQRIAKKLYCGHLLPAKVMDYIIQNRLYL